MDGSGSGAKAGRRVSHYVVERRLGAGGMGEVFLAQDLALGRPAALKLLLSGFSAPLRERLLREARTSARLQHPAIATFYDAGQDEDGTAFIAMEYVQGQTLRQRLASGALAPAEALGMAACLLEALGHAHAAGILHRDIKPENVMITGERQAKLLDFGLAKELDDEAATLTATPSLEATRTGMTAAGVMLGTPGYMSPEQLRGEPVDRRSDLFALGAVLYEALSGRPAFPGRTLAERVAAALGSPPPALSGPGVPPELAEVVRRALAQDATGRPASAAEFLASLRAIEAGEAAAVLPDSLAVLDLDNLSGQADDGWIGSGMADSVATDLARVPGLRVVGREKVVKTRAALAAAGKEADALVVGQALGCRWVLAGGFQRMGPALRVTVRLTEVATGQVAAADKHDGSLDGIFAMQDRVAAAVLRHLEVHATPPSGPPAPKLAAYECTARARRLWSTHGKGGFDQAGVLFRQALAEEPDHAPALAGLAGLHALRFTFTTDPAELETASEYARRAIAADPALGEPHVWLGYVLMRQGRMAEAVAEEREAMTLDPENHMAPYFAGCAHSFGGQRRASLALFQRSLEIEPQHGWGWLGLGWAHLGLGHPREALWSLGRAVEVERGQAQGPTAGVSAYLGEALRRLGRPAEARPHVLRGLQAVERSDHMYRDTFRAVCLCTLGRVALDQSDSEAAMAAFGQALAHLEGRPRALGGGHLAVQALAGQARARGEEPRLDAALELFAQRGRFDFTELWCCTDDASLADLAAAASDLGRQEQATDLAARARAAVDEPD